MRQAVKERCRVDGDGYGSDAKSRRREEATLSRSIQHRSTPVVDCFGSGLKHVEGGVDDSGQRFIGLNGLDERDRHVDSDNLDVF